MNYFSLLIWSASWLIGGYWITTRSFRLTAKENVPVAIIVGLTFTTLTANILARFMDPQPAFWLSAALTLLLGLAAHFKQRSHGLFQINVDWGVIVLLLFITLLFFRIGRGLSIFDDYAHLPTTSLLATGDIPPKFPLNPSISYAYHYFLLLFSAMIMRISDAPVWTALSLSRSLVFSTTTLLAGLFAYRVTRSLMGGILGGVTLGFASGTRWILLLLPPGIVNQISNKMELIGSAYASGPTLSEALVNPWLLQGSGPIAFPFAFVNGILQPGVLATFSTNSTFWLALILTILITSSRWRGNLAAIVTTVLVASMSLLTEAGILWISTGWFVLLVLWLLKKNPEENHPTLIKWLVIWGGGTALGAFQGGALTHILTNWVQSMNNQAQLSYQDVTFALAWPPAVVSSHLGVMVLTNFNQLSAAILESGPILLVLPLAAVWGWKAYRANKWFESAYIFGGLLSLSSIFIQFTGSTGIRNTPRMYMFMELGLLYFIPLFWVWLRKRGVALRILFSSLGGTVLFSGFVIFGIQLISIQRPVFASFITSLDVKMMEAHWNSLEGTGYVFDKNRFRAPVVFGRYTLAADEWATTRPDWEASVNNTDPIHLAIHGFDYLYIDQYHWSELNENSQQLLSNGCAIKVDQVTNQKGEFRRLFDLRPCRPED